MPFCHCCTLRCCLCASAACDHVVYQQHGYTPVQLVCRVGFETMSGDLVSPDQASFQQQQLDALRLLINHGATIETPDNQGTTLLHGAAAHGSPALVRHLLALGANVNAATVRVDATEYRRCCLSLSRREHLPCSALCSRCWSCCICHFFEQTCGSTPLLHACRSRSVEVVSLLLSNGADVSVVTVTGATPLHVVCQLPPPTDMPLVHLLTSVGVDPRIRSVCCNCLDCRRSFLVS